MKNIKRIALVAAAVAVCTVGGCKRKDDIPMEMSVCDIQESETETAEESLEQTEDICYVHICGEIKSPGVYRLKKGERICALVDMAGGFTENASKDYVNQAKQVEDGMKIIVPALGSEMAATAAIADAGKENGININSASKEQLCMLTGIGESRAESIIAYREAHGGFDSIEEIMKVDGIKEGAFSKIKDNIVAY